ncbi:MAG: DUF3313 family protein, partial [Pseudomonadota bacterium]
MKSSLFKSAFTAASLLMLSAGMAAHAGPFDELTIVDDTKSLASYQAVYVAPVAMDLTFDRNFRIIGRTAQLPRGASRPMNDQEIADRAHELHKRLERRLGKKLDVVDAPGEGVLTVEATVTRLISTRPTQKELIQEVGLSLNGSVSTGGADIDIRLSENGTELANISESWYPA